MSIFHFNSFLWHGLASECKFELASWASNAKFLVVAREQALSKSDPKQLTHWLRVDLYSNHERLLASRGFSSCLTSFLFLFFLSRRTCGLTSCVEPRATTGSGQEVSRQVYLQEEDNNSELRVSLFAMYLFGLGPCLRHDD